MNHLCSQSNPSKVRKALDILPTRLYDFYEEAFKIIHSQSDDDKYLATKAISYLFWARRALTLQELRHALATELGDADIDEMALPETEILLSISAGLVRLDKDTDRVSLVHRSLKEYLESTPSQLLPCVEADLARTCLTYVSLDAFKVGPCDTDAALEQRVRTYCFLPYAVQFCGVHARITQFSESMDMLDSFLSDQNKITSFVQILHDGKTYEAHRFDHNSKQIPPLYSVANRGLDVIVASLCEEGAETDWRDHDGATALHMAARNGYVETVKVLVDNNTNIDLSSIRGQTALMWAARNGHQTTVRFLLEHKADWTLKDRDGWNAADWAIVGSHNEIAKALLDEHDRSDPTNNQVNQSLILAADSGYQGTVHMLLERGADIAWKDKAGSTALCWAVPAGHEKIVHQRLQAGADANSKDIYGNSPLHWAISHQVIARLLLDHGANPDAKNHCGKTALLWTALDGVLEVLKLLVQFKANVNIEDNDGFPALHAAALRGHEDMVCFLLETGADPNKHDKHGWTPLHTAELQKFERIATILKPHTENSGQISKWAEAATGNPRTTAIRLQRAANKSDGSTVVTGLRVAVNEGYVERVLVLLRGGADADAEDVGGFTALTLATYLEYRDILLLLLTFGADVDKVERTGRSALHIACEGGDQSTAQVLVQHGADVNARVYGKPALLVAAEKGHADMVEFLVEHGADVNAEDLDQHRALHWMSKHDSAKTVMFLSERGADLEAVDRCGRTPLLWAIGGENVAIVQLLLNSGANVGRRTLDGLYPIHVAAYVGNVDLIRLLIHAGADVDARTLHNFTPLHIARMMGYQPVAEQLNTKVTNLEEMVFPNNSTADIFDTEAVKKDVSMNLQGQDNCLARSLRLRLQRLAREGEDQQVAEE